MLSNRKLNKSFIYIIVFLFTLHLTPATYIESAFLGQFMNTEGVSFIFSIASILTIIAFYIITKGLKRFGNYKTILTVIIIEIISLLIMAFSRSPMFLISAYIVGFTLRNLIWFSLDIFLESKSKDRETGGIRGYYLTVINIGYLLGPIIASLILTDHQYYKIFFISAMLEIPVLFLTLKYLKNFEDPIYQKPNLLKHFLKMRQDVDIYFTVLSNFLLQFFYAWMVIYTPIFLIFEKGFAVSEATKIISIALLPFVIFQPFLGKIADKYTGEKEILTSGFIIMGIATSLFSFIISKNFILWAIILFVTRIGAAMVESMIEIHLFKRVDSSKINIIGIFRLVRPIAYLSASILATVLLLIIDFKYLFLILGIIMLYGIRFALAIKDTK